MIPAAEIATAASDMLNGGLSFIEEARLICGLEGKSTLTPFNLYVLGWELWLTDHDWSSLDAEPIPAPGRHCAMIPVQGETDRRRSTVRETSRRRGMNSRASIRQT